MRTIILFGLFVTMLSAFVIGIVLSAVLMAFATNSVGLTLLVCGAEILALFALMAKIDCAYNA
jgi:hypothetical protein